MGLNMVEKRPITLPSDQHESGRTLGKEELALLEEVICSGTLTCTKGKMVPKLEESFAQTLNVKHAFACTSGTAAIHTAIAAIDPEPGDEIITTSITDMGALTPILYQGAIPVFADVDPLTYNVTAETIKPCISERTRAIVVTHLFGNPCEMTDIMSLAHSHNIPVIEDCAQSYLAQHDNKFVGTIGSIGCFSLQQGKHITTGEGGLIVTDDRQLARRIFLFINKAWGYGDERPDHYFLALNYRMSELVGAVALAQLDKLEFSVSRRIEIARNLTEKLRGLAGIATPLVKEGNKHTYWKYCLQVDDAVFPGGAVELAKRLRVFDIDSAPRYIQKPAFKCEIFQKQKTFGNSRFPFTLARREALDYDEAKYSGTFEALSRVLVLPLNERYESEHVDFLAQTIEKIVSDQTNGRQ